MTLRSFLITSVLLAVSGHPDLLSADGSDAVLKSLMAGTWHSTFESKDTDNPDLRVTSRGQDTYSADGRVHGVSVSHRGSREERMEYTGRWDIEGGYLVINVTAATGGYVTEETVTRDRILRLDATTLTLEAADGNTVELHRGPKPGGREATVGE
jgi:hypothetical protein